MLEAIRNPQMENPEDKMRLLLCFYFSMADTAIPKDDLAEYERALKETGVDMGPWEYAKKWVPFQPAGVLDCVLTAHYQDFGTFTGCRTSARLNPSAPPAASSSRASVRSPTG